MAEQAHLCPCAHRELPQFEWVSTLYPIARKGKRLALENLLVAVAKVNGANSVLGVIPSSARQLERMWARSPAVRAAASQL